MLAMLFAAALAAAPLPPAAPAARPDPRPAAPTTWRIDVAHSELTFRIRHLVSRVRGSFRDWSGTITADTASLRTGSVQVTIQTASIFTNNERRDTHLRSGDFFAADSFPTITFTSTRVEQTGSELRVIGNLTMRGVTRPVTLTGSFTGVQPGGQSGPPRAGFEFRARINRMDYGVRWNRVAEGGGVVLGDDVEIDITVAAIAER